MQTVGKTAEKMEFPSTWTDILLKSISSKTNNYTIDVKIGAKRIADAARDVAPKKRRKQSNPTRISAGEKCKVVGDGEETAKKERSQPHLHHHQPSSSLLPLNLTAKPDVQNAIPPDDRRPPNFPNDRPATAPKNESPSAIAVSAQTGGHYRPPKSAASPDGSLKNQLATTAVGPGGTQQYVAGVQIFNPEAFCELCNKEFCNKYFLKTHKANKHGVFVDGGQNGFLSLQQHDPPDGKNKSQQLQQLLTATRCEYNPSGRGNDRETLYKSLAAPPPFVQLQQLQTTATSKAGQHNNNNNINNNQTRAFCDVCHKEFCNKYFVRRHKAKIHGILDDCGGDHCFRQAAWDQLAPPVPLKTSFRIKNEILDFAVSDANHATDYGVNEGNYTTVSDETPRWEPSKTAGKPFADEGRGAARSVIVEAPCHHVVKVERPAAADDDHDHDEEEEENDETADRNFACYGDEPLRFADANGYREPTADSIVSYGESQWYANNECPGPDGENSTWPLTVFGDTGVPENRDDPSGTDRYGVNVAGTGAGVIVMNVAGGDAARPTERAAVAYKNDGSRDSFSNGPPPSPTPENAAVRVTTERREDKSDERRAELAAGGGEPSTSAAAPSSSFCKICNKELCNKYFMRTHMQRMHGISVRNGDHIGGVVCDVCNKELCSKYFLRVHKQNSHGIVSENGGGALHHRYWPDGAAENGQLSSAADEPSPDGAAGQLHRYYKHYAEACNVCFRRFRSPKWLSAHLLNDHGDEGRAQWNHVQNHMHQQQREADKTAAASCRPSADDPAQQMKQYRCSYCPFATSVLSFLFVHEKFHSAENGTEDAFAPRTCAAGGGSPGSDACRNSTHVSEDSVSDKPSPLDANGNDVPGPPNAVAAVPEPPANQEPFIMQSFFLENCSVCPQSVKQSESRGDGGRSDSFHSSLVYLPVKEKLTSTVNVFFKLTPT